MAKETPKRRWLADRVFLWLAGIVTAALLVASLALAENRGIEEFWVRIPFSVLILLSIAVSSMRSFLHRPNFAPYLVMWVTIHVALMYLFMREQGLFLWAFVTFVEWVVLFLIACAIFGPPEEAEQPERPEEERTGDET